MYEVELEPGQAAEHALGHPFPFDLPDALPDALASTIRYVAEHQDTIAAERERKVAKWWQRAEDLREDSLKFLRTLPYANRQILIRGEKIGEFFHVYLCAGMLRQSRHTSVPQQQQ